MIELSKPRKINDLDRVNNDPEEHVRVDVHQDESSDFNLKIATMKGRNLSENMLRTLRYNLYNHRFYLIEDFGDGNEDEKDD